MFCFRFPLRLTARCVLYDNTILARGPAARPRCIPTALVLQGIEPHFAPSKPFVVLSLAPFGCCITSQGSIPASLTSPRPRNALECVCSILVSLHSGCCPDLTQLGYPLIFTAAELAGKVFVPRRPLENSVRHVRR